VLADENDRLAKEIDFKTKDLEEKHLEETKKTKKPQLVQLRMYVSKHLLKHLKDLKLWI